MSNSLYHQVKVTSSKLMTKKCLSNQHDEIEMAVKYSVMPESFLLFCPKRKSLVNYKNYILKSYEVRFISYDSLDH